MLASQACRDALAMLVAHQTWDLVTAKRVALHLSQGYSLPWDLPTVPAFAIQVRGQVIMLESMSADSMPAVIEDLMSAGLAKPDETELLAALAQRYRERREDKTSKR